VDAHGPAPLARAIRVRGTVLRGNARGRQIGFPTANLALASDLDHLVPGVYAGRALGLPAAVNVGVRPTFEVDAAANIEVHIIGFEGDLYGRELTVDLTARIRSERRFPSIDALVEQLRRDVAAARDLAGAQISTAASQAPAASTVADSSMRIERPIARSASRVEPHADACSPRRRSSSR
jgi:Riboflavin kinase